MVESLEWMVLTQVFLLAFLILVALFVVLKIFSVCDSSFCNSGSGLFTEKSGAKHFDDSQGPYDHIAHAKFIPPAGLVYVEEEIENSSASVVALATALFAFIVL